MNRAPEHHALMRLEVPATSIRRSDYLSMKPVLDWLRTIAPDYASGVLLDYGCGNKPYGPLFRNRVRKHIGVDVEQNVFGTVEYVVPRGARIPLEDASVDAVLSTQVLEHVPEPGWYLSEAARVLKPDGHLILTCPGSYMLHEEPHDYFRYTEHGLRFLATQHGFEVIRLDPAGGAWRLLGQTFLNHKTFARSWRIPILSGILYRITVVCTNIMCTLLDAINRNTKDTANYMMIARRTRTGPS